MVGGLGIKSPMVDGLLVKSPVVLVTWYQVSKWYLSHDIKSPSGTCHMVLSLQVVLVTWC